MTIALTLTQLQNAFKAMTNPPTVILVAPKEFVNMAQFPAVIMEMPDGVSGTLTMDNRGWSRNQYPIKIYIFVGSLATTPYDQLNDRALTWIDKLRNVITPDNIADVNSVLTGRDETDQIVITYTKGQIPWGDNTQGYYGLMCQITFLERFKDWN
jgi:hypothetical protein